MNGDRLQHNIDQAYELLDRAAHRHRVDVETAITATLAASFPWAEQVDINAAAGAVIDLLCERRVLS